MFCSQDTGIVDDGVSRLPVLVFNRAEEKRGSQVEPTGNRYHKAVQSISSKSRPNNTSPVQREMLHISKCYSEVLYDSTARIVRSDERISS